MKECFARAMNRLVLKEKAKMQKLFKLIIALLCVTMHSFAREAVSAIDLISKAHDARTKVYNSSDTATKDIYQEMYGYTHTISRVLEKKPSTSYASLEQKIGIMRTIVGGIVALEDQYFKSQFIDGLPGNDNQIPIHFVKPTSDFDAQTERHYAIIERTQELARKLYRVPKGGENETLNDIAGDFDWLQSNSGIDRGQFLRLFSSVVEDHFQGIAALGRDVQGGALLVKRIGDFKKNEKDPVPQIRTLIYERSSSEKMSQEEINVEKFMALKYQEDDGSVVGNVNSNDEGVPESKGDDEFKASGSAFAELRDRELEAIVATYKAGSLKSFLSGDGLPEKFIKEHGGDNVKLLLAKIDEAIIKTEALLTKKKLEAAKAAYEQAIKDDESKTGGSAFADNEGVEESKRSEDLATYLAYYDDEDTNVEVLDPIDSMTDLNEIAAQMASVKESLAAVNGKLVDIKLGEKRQDENIVDNSPYTRDRLRKSKDKLLEEHTKLKRIEKFLKEKAGPQINADLQTKGYVAKGPKVAKRGGTLTFILPQAKAKDDIKIGGKQADNRKDMKRSLSMSDVRQPAPTIDINSADEENKIQCGMCFKKNDKTSKQCISCFTALPKG